MSRTDRSGRARGAPVLALLLLLIGLAVAVAYATRPVDLIAVPRAAPAAVTRDFSAAELAREDAFHASVRPPAYASLLVGLATALVLGLTPLGARLVARLASPFGGGWGWQVLAGGVGVALLSRVAALPLDARAEAVLRRYGLSSQTWASWLLDQAKGAALSTVLLLAVLFGFFLLVRAAPRAWWLPVAFGSAALVLVVSFVFPLIVEPVFNRFSPLPDGPLRVALLDLARADGVPVDDVLVADASRRTTALNAYVSGFGSTRRIVLYDTLLASATPQEIRLIVAHELGHAKRDDVLVGSIVGALAAAAASTLLYLVGSARPLLRRAGVSHLRDPRSLALVLALVAALTALGRPAQTLLSRRVEARADAHALLLTRDPATFAALQRRLAVRNLSDLDPPLLVYLLFATHPSAPQRIAMARSYARAAGISVPADLAP